MIQPNTLTWRALFALTVIATAVLLWGDPYTRGRIGGEFAVFTPDFHEVAVHPWQIGASLVLIFLLATTLVAGLLRARRIVALTLTLETLFFTALNVVYVARDGLLTRTTVGDEGAIGPGIVTVMGFVLRMLALLLWHFSHDRSERLGTET